MTTQLRIQHTSMKNRIKDLKAGKIIIVADPKFIVSLANKLGYPIDNDGHYLLLKVEENKQLTFI